MWYIEVARQGGKWAPQVWRGTEPQIDKDGRLKRAGSIGPRCRPIRDGYVVKAAPEYSGCTLEEVRQLYSPDGRFQAVTRKSTGAPEGLA